ncbi:MAG: hypothetical protein HQK79_15820 [Desulfobacterales bacterium]|nr:hypothetical protein [Desulfobacterales bacterium]
MKYYNKILITVIVSLFILNISHTLMACSPAPPEPSFTYSLHPDFPLEEFAKGNLGIIKPTYAKSYLYVAYRYMMGIPFNEEEQKSIQSLWIDRTLPLLGMSYGDDIESIIVGEKVKEKIGLKKEDPKEIWYAARKNIIKNEDNFYIDTMKEIQGDENYNWYENCLGDSFLTAAKTLNSLIEKFGIKSDEVQEWFQIQDKVFQNCPKGEFIPDYPKTDNNPQIKAHRIYQIASANFYSGQFDAAEKMFREIAKDDSSPWKDISPYLVVRTLFRKATLKKEIDKSILTQAEDELKKLIANKNFVAIHPAAQRLMNSIKVRLYPKERLEEIVQSVLSRNSENNLKSDVADLIWFLDKNIEKENDLVDWILTYKMEENKEEALNHSIEKWETTSSLPWLVAALSKISINHPKIVKLIEAGEKIKKNSPAFLSVSYHLIRLMIEGGKKNEAIIKLTPFIDNPVFPRSSNNLFLSLRMRVADNLDELLKYSIRIPKLIIPEIEMPLGPKSFKFFTELKEYSSGRVLFDYDSINIFNYLMPLNLLKKIAINNIIPDYLRKEIAKIVWVRSILLDNEDIAKEITPILQNFVPDLKNDLDAYLSETTKGGKKFAAIFLLLRSPGLQPFISRTLPRFTPIQKIDDFRDNWWGKSNYEKDFPKNYKEFTFLENIRDTAKKELDKLSSLGVAPNYLSSEAINWANKNPTDLRIPEALHRAVQTTRYSLADGETSKFSKAAFKLLHGKYPNNEWTNKTKYWY